jgi:hypothetical protein
MDSTDCQISTSTLLLDQSERDPDAKMAASHLCSNKECLSIFHESRVCQFPDSAIQSNHHNLHRATKQQWQNDSQRTIRSSCLLSLQRRQIVRIPNADSKDIMGTAQNPQNFGGLGADSFFSHTVQHHQRPLVHHSLMSSTTPSCPPPLPLVLHPLPLRVPVRLATREYSRRTCISNIRFFSVNMINGTIQDFGNWLYLQDLAQKFQVST